MGATLYDFATEFSQAADATDLVFHRQDKDLARSMSCGFFSLRATGIEKSPSEHLCWHLVSRKT